MLLTEFHVPLMESVTVSQFKTWMENPVTFEADLDDLKTDIAAAGGLMRFVINGNRWIKTLTFPLVVYRGLSLKDPEAWIRDHTRSVGQDLGVYWTDKLEIAIDQNGPDGTFARGETNLVMVGVIDEAAVDWCCTIAMQAVDTEEPEIRLIKGSPIRLREIVLLDTSTPNEREPVEHDDDGQEVMAKPHYDFDHRHITKTIAINRTLKV